jgi:hypothetical protein
MNATRDGALHIGGRPATALTEDLALLGNVSYGRNGIGQPPEGNLNPACGNVYNWRDCWTFSDGSPSSIAYTPYSVGLSLTGDASVTYRGIAKLDIAAATPTVGGLAVAVDAPEWLWTPEDPVKYGGPRTNQCGGGAASTHCEFYVEHSGTMQARAYVNGTMKDAPPMRVALKDSVYATASPSNGLVNYASTFTVTNTADTAWYFDGWGKFYPDAGGQMWITTCPTKWVPGRSESCGPWNVPSSGRAVFYVIVHNNYPMTVSVRVMVSNADSIANGACTVYDKHCPITFFAPSNTDMAWLIDAAEATTCPWMKSWMNLSILHGWLHLTDEAAWANLPINAATHVLNPATVDSSFARVHFDRINAFTTSAALAHTFRHETAHVYGYGRVPGMDAQADSVANSCSP